MVTGVSEYRNCQTGQATMYAYSQNHGPCAKQTVGSPDLCAYSRSAEDATQGEPLGVVMVKGQGSEEN